MLRAPSFVRPVFLKDKGLVERYFYLHQEPLVQAFFKSNHPCIPFLETLPLEERYVLEAMLLLGEGERLFSWPFDWDSCILPLQLLAKDLLAVEKFYAKMGGIFGYFEKIREFASGQVTQETDLRFFKPEVIDIRQDSQEVQRMTFAGLEHLPEFAAIFPVGGVGDRLGLTDPETREPLPTAMLPFLGKTLFDLMLRDCASLEYLYWKKFQKKLFLPIVIMTSQEKQNHERILSLCEEQNWFGRPKESFCIIQQISAPVVTKSGRWVVPAPLQLAWKPGGHGMLWKLMQDSGVFSWLSSLGKTKAFVRQINNPVAGTDGGILALMGYGVLEKKTFGFAACPRRVHTAEGVDVLKEKRTKTGYEYGFTNIEYTDFAKWKIQDVAKEGGLYSEYPSNTNLLYVDLPEAKLAIEKNPFVGMMLNMKSKFSNLQKDGSVKEEIAGRLELMMQAIADQMTDSFSSPLKKEEQKKLKTFVLYNERKKTISTTKKLFEKGEILETPEGCYFDLLHNHYDLLSKVCKVELPLLGDEKEYLQKGPSFHILFHPSLGPLYSEIEKKICRGKFFFGAELQLEIAELLLENLHLDGSLLIQAENFSEENGARCILKNVRISNLGIDRTVPNVYWQNKIARKESLRIILEKNAVFYAENLLLKGDLTIHVKAGLKKIALEKEGKLEFIDEPL